MSFGSGGFGGFGQNTNTAQPGGFGGFGSNNTAPSAFGQPATGGFAQNSTAGGGLFGGSSANTGGGFGASTGGGFGSNTGGGFGSKPTFGASTSGGLFGGNTNNANTTSSFGSFGGTTVVNPTTSAFGGGANTTGGMFGANKPGFGTATNTGNSLFGGGNTTSGGFGTTSTGFAATGAVGDPPGTASTPFNAYTEKEPNTSTTNSFQNILFQEPYKKWSSEELRLVDYAQGRRHGNATGGGAFGVSSGFGGFASNANANQTTTGFGQTNTNTASGGLFGNNAGNTTTTGAGFGSGGFGANANPTNTAAGGLFGGGNKPAGGLFGNSNTQTQQSSGGGLFGSGGTGAFGNSNTAGAFGQTNTTNTAGGGLFGNAANKTTGTGFSFGNTNNANTNTASTFGGNATGTAFGSNTANTGGGLFGNNAANTQTTGGTLFGGQNNQQQNTGTGFGGGFGQQNQNQQSGGLFGNQQKPAAGGLFGNNAATGTTGGLFGGGNAQQQQQNTGGGLFGAATNATAGGGLFGGGNKPTTSGGLFGGGNAAQTTTGGSTLFGGSNQQQQPAGGGLFGASTNQQKPGGLFGSSTQTGGLFGGQNNPAQGSSLFGGNANQQQNQNTLGNSLLGNTQQNNNVPQSLTANLNDVSAYGSPSLFAGLGGNDVANPGPLATPLNGNSKPRKSSILPMYKLAPATAASRFATPQKRGFGFSYSSYGTPGGSPASSISSTPGAMGRSLLGASSGGSLSKSISASNLRRSFNTEDSILAPGAFSSSSSARWYGSTGSKKLVINRDIRSDLFSTPQKDKTEVNGSARKLSKRVSFDTGNVESEDGTPVRNALPAPEDTPRPQADETTPRQNRTTNDTNGSQTPEMEQVKGNELAIVHEEDNSATPEARAPLGFENAPGDYWMQPTRDELQNMNRMQRLRVDNFTVGRDNVGYIKFKVPVDISSIELDDLCGGIIQLEPRSATVYPVQAKKPPVGKGLNVPAQISLEQSWPRGGRDKRITSDPKRFNKHVERLKRIPDTTFESYDKNTGVWTFGVEHFTTYGLDDSDEESDEEMPPPPGLATPPQRASNAAATMDVSTHEDGRPGFRQNAALPGAFDEQDDLYGREDVGKQSFLGISSADSAPNDVRLSLEEDYASERGDEYDLSEDEDMTRSSIGQHLAAELDEDSSENEQDAKRGTPGGILRARMRAMKDQVGPVTLEVADGDDWMEMLRKTVSPVKRDRQLLREMNDSPSKFSLGLDGGDNNFEQDLRKSSIWGKSMSQKERTSGLASAQMAADKGRGFATSIDLMNSLFEKPKPLRQNVRSPVSAKGFPQWPYERQDKNFPINSEEKAYHDATRPTWGPDETLVVTRPLDTIQSRRRFRDNSDLVQFQRSGIQTDRQDIRLAKLSMEPSKKFLRAQDKVTEIRLAGDVPMATLRAGSLQDVFHHQEMNNPGHLNEKRVWELASILFDGVANSGEPELDYMPRKQKLSQFWTELVEQASTTNIGLAHSGEMKAVASLAGHRITEACKFLLDEKNFRLGTLVPLIGTSDAAKKDIREQLKAWHESKMLSEFSEEIRTVYELLSGNVCVCEGVKSVPVEDRMESFVISKKFGLDWRQAFGLRLWYAISQQDSPALAVLKFKDDINQDKEEPPRPWYYEQGLKPVWNDTQEGNRQDLLWGLLQLYADKSVDLEAILRPENSQLSPLNMRLSWQLGQALVSTGQVSFGKNGDEKADASTISYASQLTAAGEWLEAVFVLLHLKNSSVRMKAIQEHLCRHAGMIGPDTGATFTLLTEKFRIPASWLWEALALYMRSVKKDAPAEVHCLLRAGEFVEAHRVLVQQVAPQAVIERDYATLSSLLSQFQGRAEFIPEWTQGGEIYSYFLSLVHHCGKGESPPHTLLEKLLAGLNVMKEYVGETKVLRYAAVSDMADDTAREILKLAKKKQDAELRSRILSLPLTQDRLLAYSVDLSLDRYREVMSH